MKLLSKGEASSADLGLGPKLGPTLFYGRARYHFLLLNLDEWLRPLDRLRSHATRWRHRRIPLDPRLTDLRSRNRLLNRSLTCRCWRMRNRLRSSFFEMGKSIINFIIGLFFFFETYCLSTGLHRLQLVLRRRRARLRLQCWLAWLLLCVICGSDRTGRLHPGLG